MDKIHQKPTSETNEPVQETITLSPPIPCLRRIQFERRNLLPTGILLTFLLCIATFLIGQLTFVVHVKVDGEVVGALSDSQEFEELFDTTHEHAASLLDDASDLVERLSYSYRIATIAVLDTLDTAPIEREILERIDGISIYYAITVDGIFAGHVSDLSVFQTAKEERLEALEADESMRSVTLLSDFTIEDNVVEQGEALTIVEILELVDSLSVEKVQEISYVEPIPFEVSITEDDTLLEGMIEVLREGAYGEAQVVAQVTYIDGYEVEHVILDTKVVSEAVAELVVVGTLVRPLTASWGEYIWPTTGTLSSLFGPRRVAIGSSNHQGIDITAPHGTPVYAADGGEVFFVGFSGGFGNLIKIEHDNGHVTYYAHLSSMTVQVGERVYRGQHLGGVGMTGTASGNHLHFEIRINGVPVDPIPWLP